MLKFKREDIGFYIVCAIGGGGVGFLTGSVIAMVIAKRKQKQMEEDWMQAEFEFKEGPKPEAMVEAAREATEVIVNIKEYAIEEDEEVEDPYSMEEVEAFIEKHDLQDIQVTMLRAGDITMEEVSETLINKKIKKDYGAIYRDDKPDLDVLLTGEEFEDDSPDSEDVIDDRWQLNESLPVDKLSQNVKVVYWDEENDSFYRLRRGSSTVPITIEQYISKNAWSAVHYWFDLGWDTIFVDDLDTVRVVKVVKDAAETEGSAEDDVS